MPVPAGDSPVRTWARSSEEAATKTNDVAGDGTTTATVLAQAMIGEGSRNIAAGAHPIIIGRSRARRATGKRVTLLQEYVSYIELVALGEAGKYPDRAP